MTRSARCRVTFLALLLTGSSLVAHAQSPDASAHPPVTDPAQVRSHYLEVLARPEFQEHAGPDANAELRERLSGWFTRLTEGIDQFQYLQQMPRFASLLMTGLALLSLVGLVYTVARMLRRRRARAAGLALQENAATSALRIPEDCARELQAARAAGDWRRAWLASWRQFLARLEQNHLVEADRSRTNREYLRQLRAHALPAAAETLLPRLVDDYDGRIYGQQPIAEQDWSAFQQQVTEAALMLHLDDEAAPGDPHPEAP